ncbi:MAG: hypothetical protein M3N08_07525 [Pseudomonadota bacterium]|nr:hypothetical protein [Pseudomonadota bacterium]
MDIFVPRFLLDLPPAGNDAALNIILAKIHADDLPNVMQHWAALPKNDPLAIKQHFRSSVKTVCRHPVEKHAFERYLRRPHVTIHSGAREGNEHASARARNAAYTMGRLVATHGFNLMYGGGHQGLMGQSMKGFSDQLAIQRFPDQYSIQVSPAQFVVGVQSANGLRAVNEGLSNNTDAAIVTPSFVLRRHLLDTTLTNKDAATTVIGADGSLDEWSDIAAHVKTGLIDTNLYVLNLQLPVVVMGLEIPFMKTRFWGPLQKQRKNFVKYGYGTQAAMDRMPFLNSPEEIFSHLMKKLEQEGNNPHSVYEERLKLVQRPTPVVPAAGNALTPGPTV